MNSTRPVASPSTRIREDTGVHESDRRHQDQIRRASTRVGSEGDKPRHLSGRYGCSPNKLAGWTNSRTLLSLTPILVDTPKAVAPLSPIAPQSPLPKSTRGPGIGHSRR